MSTRQAILDAVKTDFQTILTSGGYNTNAGQNVYIHRDTPLNDTEMPAIVISDSETVDAIAFQQEIHTLHLDMELIGNGATVDALARQVLEDVLKIIQLDPTWGGLAEDTVIPREDVLDTEAREQRYGGLLLKVDIEYTTDLYST